MSYEEGLGTGDELGGILPTVVTPDDARAYIEEVAAEWESLANDVTRSNVDDQTKTAFVQDLVGWRAFRVSALANVGFFNTKATMDQTDRWAAKVGPWRTSIIAAGGKVSGPAPTKPGQGVDDPATSTALKLGVALVAGALVVAGIFGVGYVASNFRRAGRIASKVIPGISK